MSIRAIYLTRNHRFALANYLLVQVLFFYWVHMFAKGFQGVGLIVTAVVVFLLITTLFLIFKLKKISISFMKISIFLCLLYFFLGGGRFSFGMSIFLLVWIGVFLFVITAWSYELAEAYFNPLMSRNDLAPPKYSFPAIIKKEHDPDSNALISNATLSGCFLITDVKCMLLDKITIFVEVNSEKYQATGTIVRKTSFGVGISFGESSVGEKREWDQIISRFIELGQFNRSER